MSLPGPADGPLPDNLRRDLCRVRLDDEVFRLPEFARQEYKAKWTDRLNQLLAVDIDAAERYVKEVQAARRSMGWALVIRNPVNQRAARGFLGIIIVFCLTAVVVALLGRFFVVQQAGGLSADVQAAAVGNATGVTRILWEGCMPGLLLAMAALTWVNPARHLLILCGGLALALAITGWVLGLGVPLVFLVISAALVILRVVIRPTTS